MNRKITIFTFLLALAVVFTACGESSGDGAHETFSMFIVGSPPELYVSYSDNPVVRYIEERFDVTFEFEQPAVGTEFDALSIMFGTAQFTDVVAITMYTGSVLELYLDGVIINFANYLQYMPNFSALMDANPEWARTLMDEDGRILAINSLEQAPSNPWIGLAYRHDILVYMTNDNVQFPSGYDEPMTIADWEYMLPIFVDYFRQQGKVEYAGLILPPQGFFPFGELSDSFGTMFHLWVDGTETHFGPFTDEWREYLETMNRWFANGWIYGDFAARVQDMFFMPNPALTHGNAAGIFMTFPHNLGDAMSDWDNNIIYDLRPLRSPIGPGRTSADMLMRIPPPTDGSGMEYVVTTGTQNIPRLLSILDFFYSEEGGMLTVFGMRADQIPEGDTLHNQHGLEAGTHWFENNQLIFNPALVQGGGSVPLIDFTGDQFPGFRPNRYLVENVSELESYAFSRWAYHDRYTVRRALPPLALTETEQAIADRFTSAVMDEVQTMTPRFIIGVEPLTDVSWASYINRLNDLGATEMLEAFRAAYSRRQAIR